MEVDEGWKEVKLTTQYKSTYKTNKYESSYKNEDFTPEDGYYMTGEGEMVYQSAGTGYNTTYCDKYCGYCGRCGGKYSNW